MAQRGLWHCPKCGAHLVSRNLWHSRGKFSLEDLFSGSAPGILAAARKYVRLLESLGDVQILPLKTRLVAVARVRFAGLYPRKNHFMAAFALQRWLADPRIVKKVDDGPRWRGHYVRITTAADLDDELRGWLQESHDILGMQSDIYRRSSFRISQSKSENTGSCGPGLFPAGEQIIDVLFAVEIQPGWPCCSQALAGTAVDGMAERGPLVRWHRGLRVDVQLPGLGRGQ